MAIILGNDSSNTLTGSSADDTIRGQDGDDTLFGNGGRDSLDGGAGFDTVDFAGTPGDPDLNVDLAAGTESAITNNVLVSIEAVNGAGGGDAILGHDGANWLDGRSGDDSVNGAGGDDTLLGGLGSNLLDGGAGQDTASYGWAAASVFVNLADGFASVDDPASDAPMAEDALLNIEHVIGGSVDDAITGDGGTNSLLGGGGDDTLTGGGGDDTLIGGGGSDLIGGGGGNDTTVYNGRWSDYAISASDSAFVIADRSTGDGTDTVAGVEAFQFADRTLTAANLLTGTPSPPPAPPAPPTNTVIGTEGNDTLIGGAGDDVLDGGAGYDVASMGGFRGAGPRASGNGGVTVTTSLGTDTLTNVEVAFFADGRLVMDAEDAAARVVRLYEAALDRLPDQGGLNFWIDAVQDGRSLSELARGFLGSGEFRARFGDMADNGAFVDRLYQNVLGRAGEAEGRKFWIDSMNNGAGRADVLVSFSESAENKAGTAALVQAGIWDRSEAATEVARLYDTVFGRLADVGGLTYWKNGLEGGTATLGQMADAFTGSAEFRAQYGSLNNRQFADALYVNSLDRPADQAGLDYWAAQLDAGVARSAVVLAFSESAEHVALTAANIQSENPGEFGILFA